MRDREDRLAEEVVARRTIAARARRRGDVFDPAELVGAVVVTFGDGAHVGHLLRRLAREVAAIAVVDLSSKDDTVAQAARALPGVEPVVVPLAAGYGAAVNTGARLLDQPFLLIVHGDARPRPGAIGLLLAAVAPDDGRVGCAGVRVVSPLGDLEPSAGFRPTVRGHVGARLLRSLPRYTRYYVRRPSRFAPHQRTDVGWVSDVTLMVRRDAFDEVGGMDEAYFHAYLARDFGLRLREAGWRVVHEIRAAAIHLDLVDESAASVRRGRRRFAATHGALRHLRRRRAAGRCR
jgi:N-acetylglucosaminyl-diphospho-decaprenol L-rhamnosyltransferase